MKTPTSSGSFGFSRDPDKLVGTMDFYEGGDVNIFTANASSIDPEILETFKITVAFVLHSLNRADWMTDFFVNHYTGEMENPEEVASLARSHLTLIKGGKEE